MTTIAYHHEDKEIAVDSRLMIGDTIATDKGIKFIKNDVGIWFFSGSRHDTKALSKLKHKDESKDLDAIAMLISDRKAYGVSVRDGYCSHTLYDNNFAFGSGCDFALAAMDHGKSAKEAVKYAMTRDVYTGGRVRVFKV